MKRVNHSVINAYELILDKVNHTAELRRYNRPATACDESEIFVQKLSEDSYYRLMTWFAGVSYFRENDHAEWYTCGLTFPGCENSFRTGHLFRL